MLKHEVVYGKLVQEILRRLQSSVFVLPTEQELCSRFGTSRQTLRKALGRLKEEQILSSRQGSGYILTGLYPNRANRIVILAQSDEVYLYPRFLAQVTGFFGRQHYDAAVILTNGDTETEREILERLLAEPPRGLFSCARRSILPTCNADLYEALADAGTKLVFPFGKYPNVQAGRSSLADDEQGGYLLTEYLLRQGCVTCAMLLIEGDECGQQRYLGYCRAKAAMQLPVHDSYVIRIPPEEADRIREDHTDSVIRTWLEKLPADTDSIICQQDELAFTVVHALEKQGIHVPAMMKVAGFDNSHLRTAGRISLTTMQRVGLGETQAACMAMMQQLTGSGDEPEKDTWKIVRGGTA